MNGESMPSTRRPRRSQSAPLYLRKVCITNVRGFDRIEFDLESDGQPRDGQAGGGQPRMWGVVLGDNGVGKTTLLRCIAMGLCDAGSAAGLLRELYGEWHRQVNGKTAKVAEIRIEFFQPEDALDPPPTSTLELFGKNPVTAKYNKTRTFGTVLADQLSFHGKGSLPVVMALPGELLAQKMSMIMQLPTLCIPCLIMTLHSKILSSCYVV